MPETPRSMPGDNNKMRLLAAILGGAGMPGGYMQQGMQQGDPAAQASPYPMQRPPGGMMR